MAVQPVLTSDSWITRVDFDPETGFMEVFFLEGDKTSKYYKVPPEIFQEFVCSASMGKYYNQNIRGRYKPDGA